MAIDYINKPIDNNKWLIENTYPSYNLKQRRYHLCLFLYSTTAMRTKLNINTFQVQEFWQKAWSFLIL